MQVLPLQTILTNVTSKGQTTIPLPIRQFLGIHAKRKVAFLLDSQTQTVKISAADSPLNQSFRAIPPLGKPLTFKDMSSVAAQEAVSAQP